MSSVELHPVFGALAAVELNNQSFDLALERAADHLTVVFFWGHDCPNCDVAKTMFHQEIEVVRGLGLNWFHVNVYENFELGTRFGLFGIPAFLFFHKGKRLGKISPFPGIHPFLSAVVDLQTRLATG